MVKLNLYFIDKEKYRGFRKGIVNISEILENNPKTNFHKEVFNKLKPYLDNINEWLVKFYRTKLPFKEVDLVIVDRSPKSDGFTYSISNPPKIFLGINEEDLAWGEKGNFVYLIHEFGHLYESHFLNSFLKNSYLFLLGNYNDFDEGK